MTEKNKVYNLIIDDVHPSINAWAGKHWTKRASIHDDWMQRTKVAAMQAKLPKFKEPVEVFLHYFHPRENVDLDNFTPKHIMDYLKFHFGDDSIRYVKKLGWKFHKSKTKRTVVVIKLYNENEDLETVDKSLWP